ncbi:uncharacterized protein BJX67DRAFT_366133, partial [Aspergillus lucknowensis]
MIRGGKYPIYSNCHLHMNAHTPPQSLNSPTIWLRVRHKWIPSIYLWGTTEVGIVCG